MSTTPARDEGAGARWHGLELVARGTHRICVRDPASPAHVLKIQRPPAERGDPGLRERMRRAWAWHLPAFGDNAVELRAYRRLRARLGNALDGRFAACDRLVDTPFGPALRAQCVLDGTGAPAPSLFRLLYDATPQARARFRPAALCAAVDDVEAWLLRHRVPLFDLNAGNFVVVGPTEAPRLVCVDCKSTAAGKEPVPVSRWLPPLLRRKVARRAERLRRRIRAAFGPTTS